MVNIQSELIRKNNNFQALTGREDAYFLYENWLGIADGVRHWSFEGTNSGIGLFVFRFFSSNLL